MSAVKALQQWCRLRCEGYRDVSITNMTTSFRDGMAFCALIHKHRPDLINFDSLKKENVYDNNKLAFQVAEEQLGIPALLDAEDMVALKIPDRLSILTYVSQYYNYFHGRSPIGGMAGIKRPADEPTDEPAGKKYEPVSAKVFPSSKPARENSPPRSSNITKPFPSPKQSRNAMQNVLVEKSNKTGTLSNKCASCNQHVHLVQRQMVDGKLYHRNCAKSLSSTSAPLQDLSRNTAFTKYTPHSNFTKPNTTTPTTTPSRLEKPSTTPSFSTTFSPSSSSSSSSSSRPASSLFSPAKEIQTSASVSKPAASQTTVTTTTSVVTRPVAAPRTSTTAVKTQQSKLKFWQTDHTTKNEDSKTATKNADVNRGLNVTGKTQEATGGQSVTVVINVPGRKEMNVTLDKGERWKAGGEKVYVKQDDDESSKKKASAAAFISKKVTEENNNSKPSWVNVALKKTEKPSQIETPKRETEGVRGRVKLKADPSLLADFHPASDPPSSAPSPASRSGLGARTPERGSSKAGSASPVTPASDNESPVDWRSKLKPIGGKDTKPAGSSQSSAKPWANGGGKTSEPSSSSHLSSLNITVTPPASKGFLNGQTANGGKSESQVAKVLNEGEDETLKKPDYIPKENIIKELQDIEDNLNELEKRGVELEMKLRSSEEEGEDDSLMDDLMVEWFNLIRNKQVAMRRESELVYIGKTQDLEEQQPTVEQELRRLMEKPEHLKTPLDKKKEQQLMDKLVGIVNDRNAIIDGLDEDRLREEEEDEELNKMMMNFNLKKDKPKKKSPMSKLLGWKKDKKEG
ncbi:protein-methionine sulfoxide oxidase mical2b [Scomber scombrus]|uniref:Protein-methionine sulfoxide oxidase mical2b n=1 Tax=Scomber scombrus TaxID=13677 RepID=A0AAV1PP02_SCOSC